MRIFVGLVISCFSCFSLHAQVNKFSNPVLIKYLKANSRYNNRKANVLSGFSRTPAGHWGEFVKGVKTNFVTNRKVVAFTFDACGGKGRGRAYNADLINFLRKEKVPATLFVTGLWIDENYKSFLDLARDTLFEIENHGLNHRPCSSKGASIYGIRGTRNIADAYDEVEANAEKIRLITGRRPLIYRSATAYTDEKSVQMASKLGISVISFSILSGDAMAKTPTNILVSNVMDHIKPGSIIIMHFNHPENKTYSALQTIIPELRRQGYSFVKLGRMPLKEK
ncbi:MAG: polysaccharide deacetylase family protein [Bacteroidota bacterium]|nr:polysaccharide deacetylase family protein [Bacteroidota bacterium]